MPNRDAGLNDFLVTYLDMIDEAFLDYLDDDHELPPEVVVRLKRYASAPVEGSISPADIAEDWPDEEMHVTPTEADFHYLRVLEP